MSLIPVVVKAKQLKKATPVAGTSHAKGGKFGGVSNYNDADVAEAKEYMESVLGLSEMSISGRALEHILAEVYALGSLDTSKVKAQNAEFLSRIGVLENTVKKLTKGLEQASAQLEEATKGLEQASAQLEEAKKSGATIIKLDKEKVAELKTGRRIKE